MPVRIEYYVNERQVKTLHIARIDSALDRNPGKEHTYSVIESKNQPQNDHEWDDGVHFQHVYGEDILALGDRAYEALKAQESSQ